MEEYANSQLSVAQIDSNNTIKTDNERQIKLQKSIGQEIQSIDNSQDIQEQNNWYLVPDKDIAVSEQENEKEDLDQDEDDDDDNDDANDGEEQQEEERDSNNKNSNRERNSKFSMQKRKQTLKQQENILQKTELFQRQNEEIIERKQEINRKYINGLVYMRELTSERKIPKAVTSYVSVLILFFVLYVAAVFISQLIMTNDMTSLQNQLVVQILPQQFNAYYNKILYGKYLSIQNKMGFVDNNLVLFPLDFLIQTYITSAKEQEQQLLSDYQYLIFSYTATMQQQGDIDQYLDISYFSAGKIAKLLTNPSFLIQICLSQMIKMQENQTEENRMDSFQFLRKNILLNTKYLKQVVEISVQDSLALMTSLTTKIIYIALICVLSILLIGITTIPLIKEIKLYQTCLLSTFCTLKLYQGLMEQERLQSFIDGYAQIFNCLPNVDAYTHNILYSYINISFSNQSNHENNLKDSLYKKSPSNQKSLKPPQPIIKPQQLENEIAKSKLINETNQEKEFKMSRQNSNNQLMSFMSKLNGSQLVNGESHDQLKINPILQNQFQSNLSFGQTKLQKEASKVTKTSNSTHIKQSNEVNTQRHTHEQSKKQNKLDSSLQSKVDNFKLGRLKSLRLLMFMVTITFIFFMIICILVAKQNADMISPIQINSTAISLHFCQTNLLIYSNLLAFDKYLIANNQEYNKVYDISDHEQMQDSMQILIDEIPNYQSVLIENILNLQIYTESQKQALLQLLQGDICNLVISLGNVITANSTCGSNVNKDIFSKGILGSIESMRSLILNYQTSIFQAETPNSQDIYSFINNPLHIENFIKGFDFMGSIIHNFSTLINTTNIDIINTFSNFIATYYYTFGISLIVLFLILIFFHVKKLKQQIFCLQASIKLIPQDYFQDERIQHILKRLCSL